MSFNKKFPTFFSLIKRLKTLEVKLITEKIEWKKHLKKYIIKNKF